LNISFAIMRIAAYQKIFLTSNPGYATIQVKMTIYQPCKTFY